MPAMVDWTRLELLTPKTKYTPTPSYMEGEEEGGGGGVVKRWPANHFTIHGPAAHLKSPRPSPGIFQDGRFYKSHIASHTQSRKKSPNRTDDSLPQSAICFFG